jgi:hypothetical protein
LEYHTKVNATTTSLACVRQPKLTLTKQPEKQNEKIRKNTKLLTQNTHKYAKTLPQQTKKDPQKTRAQHQTKKQP